MLKNSITFKATDEFSESSQMGWGGASLPIQKLSLQNGLFTMNQ